MHDYIRIKPIPEFEDKEEGYSLEEFLLAFSSMYLQEGYELPELKLASIAKNLLEDLSKGETTRDTAAKELAIGIVCQSQWLYESSLKGMGISRTTDLNRENAVLHFYEIFLEIYTEDEFQDKVFLISRVFDNDKEASEFDMLLYLLIDKPEDLMGVRIGSALFSDDFRSMLTATRNLKKSIETNKRPLKSLAEPGSKFMRDSRSLGNRDLTLYRLLEEVFPESIRGLSENSAMKEIFSKYPKVRDFIRLAFNSSYSIFRLEEFFSEDSRPLEAIVKVAVQSNFRVSKYYTFHAFEELSSLDLHSDEDPQKLLALAIGYYNFFGPYSYSRDAFTPWFRLDGAILIDFRDYIMPESFLELFSLIYDYPEALSGLTVPMVIRLFTDLEDFTDNTGFKEELLRLDK